MKNPSSLPHSHSHDDGFATMLGEDKGEDSTPCRARLLLWLAGPYELTQETPSRPLYEPFGTAQNTAASSCSGEATGTTSHETPLRMTICGWWSR